jgi:Mg-chelatase subunit ChlI
MKCGSQIAVAVAGGYLLGRTRKTRLAAFLALLAAGGKLPIDQRELLRRTPLGEPLEKLTGNLRSQLVDAGMSVAKKAASSRIDSFSDKLQQRAESMRGTGSVAPEEEEEEEEMPAPRRRPRRPREEEPRRARRREEPPEEYDEDFDDEDLDYDDDYDDEDEEPEPRYREERRPRGRSTRPGGGRASARDDDRPRRGRSPR